MYYPFVRKALFQLDPERAHEVTFQQLRRVTGTPLEMLGSPEGTGQACHLHGANL
ncbi:dihydroorotate dehydrogenase 2 [Klebsiella pneumoniae]|uniref:Dihydroorotate dehydrogenase 2 n=1 Tax=Klebsiella pneumoniae TaxID=573 RepID=A0A2X3E900_KLEPN|nr:dihydroorotate dehydrogenase 2 [Klebsiella pneumoniae]